MGKSNPIPPSLTPQDIIRFWGYINKTTGQGPQGTCWEWTKGKNCGYGSFRIGGRRNSRHILAHRLSFFLTLGIWSVVNICHHCDNPPCCNPEHLFEGDDKANLTDARQKGRVPLGWAGGLPDNRGDNNGIRKHPERLPKGSQKRNARFTESTVIEMRQIYSQESLSLRALAERYNAPLSTIQQIIERKTWKHI